MFYRRWIIAGIVSMLLMAAPNVAVLSAATKPASSETQATEKKAAEKKPDNRYLRIVKDKDGEPQSLETAIIRLQPKEAQRDIVIDLIGAIHVAEPEYYDQLNREFNQYDAVLYELVAPEGTRPQQGSENENAGVIRTMQHGLTDLLDLEHQLEGINYDRKQFVHADLSPTEFFESMRQREESVFGYVVRLFAASAAQQAMQKNGGTDDMMVLAALFSPDRASALKRVMAPQFVNMETTMFLIDGPKGSTLIAARNQKAVDVLQDEIRQGKKKIAIFYGAGHLPDLERRLIQQLKLRRGETRWLKAWDLRKK